MVLSPKQVEAFVERGFVRLDAAFPRSVALDCQRLLWEQLAPMRPDDPSTWDRPVAQLPSQGAPPFRAAVASERWLTAITQLAGPRAVAHPHLAGAVLVRFPVGGVLDDDGWHIDTSYPVDGDWWANHRSRERALLMLVLLSDIGDDDAPTRIRAGSHWDIARALVPFGDAGTPLSGVTAALAATAHRPVELATGEAGDVYLCHPFVVHAAQAHHGTRPRFLGQPGVLLDGGYTPDDHHPVTRPLGQPRSDVGLPAAAERAQPIERLAGGDPDEVRTPIVHRLEVDARPSQPGLLQRVLRVGRRSEHPVSDGEQQVAVGGERIGEGVRTAVAVPGGAAILGCGLRRAGHG